MSQVVFINAGHDTAGVGWAYKAAFDAAAPGWKARAICRDTTYLNYPTDLVWTRQSPRKAHRFIDGIMAAADVVHAMNAPRPLEWWEWRQEQKLVVHHLGTTYRRNPEAISARCRELEAIEVTDSIDLMLFPHIRWLPIPADLEALARLRTAHYRSGPIRIAHAPTDREAKDTELIISAVTELQQRYPIEFDLIEKASNAHCLKRKAKADIFIDQLKYGFGVNAIECWAMGIPVVSGWQDPAARERCLAMWGQLPWADATPATLVSVIEHLLRTPEWREELGQRGRRHAERWHSQESVVSQTLAVYEGGA